MNVQLRMMFKPITEIDWRAMNEVAKSLTKEPAKIRVFADVEPGWLIAEFTMPTEAQYKAVDKVSWAIRVNRARYSDLIIRFPLTAAQRARADRKAAKIRAARKAKSALNG